MTDYNYYEAVKDDVIDPINDQFKKRLSEFSSLEEFREALEEDAWTDDQVTGNASGSYTFSTREAEENLCHNWDLLEDALSEFGSEFDLGKGAEYYDVTVRCYVLGQVLDEVIEEAGIDEDSFRNDEEEEEE